MRGLDDLGFGQESIDDVFEPAARPHGALIVYEGAEPPRDPEALEGWIRDCLPMGAGVVFLMPDNGRDDTGPGVRTW